MTALLAMTSLYPTHTWTTLLISSCKKAWGLFLPKSTSAMAIVLSLTTLKITTFSGCPGTISCMSTVALPFGLRPAPFIFTQFAEAWHWILQYRHGICYLLHYLDDYITVGASNSRECDKNLSSIGSYSFSLGILLALEKIEGPSTVLSFLGIKLITFLFVACLWAERVSTLQNLLQSWSNKHICRHQELESLLSHLHHAAKVVYPGSPFICCLTDLHCGTCSQSQLICLNSDTG